MSSGILNTEERLSLEAVLRLSASRGEPAWLQEKRRQAWDLFEKLPTPDWTRGIRGWWASHLTEIKFDQLKPYAPANSNTPDFGSFGKRYGEAKPSGLLIQHNSEVVKVELSEEAKTAGVWFGSLDQAVKEKPELVEKYFMTRCVPVNEDRIIALHAALWSGGAFLYVPARIVLEAPFQVFNYTDEPGLACFNHTLVVAEKNSRIKLVEEQRSPDGTEPNLDAGVVEIFANEGAKVEYYNPQEWGNTVNSYNLKRAMIGRDAFHRWVVATLGSRSTWQNVESVFEGENASGETTGLSFSRGNQHFDIKARSLHTGPHTTANTLFKVVLDDRSQTGFQGAIRVLKNGQHTDSFLEDHTLFLSEASKADALPSLDVDANDVRCSHGASIGMIDAEQVFYLQSRGLDKIQAEKMIVGGFFEDVIARIPLESVREHIRDSIDFKQGGESYRDRVGDEALFVFNEVE